MFRIIPLLTILLLSAVTGKAQNYSDKNSANYKDAIAITVEGDTLRGQIDYKQWSVNPASVVLVGPASEQIFTADQLREFRVEGDIYRSAQVDLDISPMSLGSFNAWPYPTIAKDTTVFLLLLVEGAANLYYLRDKSGKEHFFYQENKPEDPDVYFIPEQGLAVRELGYYRFYADGTKTEVVTKEIFKGQLKALAASCQSLKVSANIGYNSKDLVEFFRQYNYCTSGEVLTFRNESIHKSGLSMFLLTGAQYATIRAQKFLWVYRADEVVNHQLQWVVGLGVNYLIPRSLDKFGITAKAVYYRQHFNPAYDFKLRLSQSSINELTYQISDDYKLDYLQLATSFRYYFRSTITWKPFVSLGPSFNFMVNNSLSKEIVYIDDSGNKHEAEYEAYSYPSFLLGAHLGLGLGWRKWGVELLYYQDAIQKGTGVGAYQASGISGQLTYSLFDN